MKQTVQVESGIWRVVGDELVQTDNSPNRPRAIYFGGLDWTDYDFTGELLREKQQGRNALVYRSILRNNNHLDLGNSGDQDCQGNAFEDGNEQELKGTTSTLPAAGAIVLASVFARSVSCLRSTMTSGGRLPLARRQGEPASDGAGRMGNRELPLSVQKTQDHLAGQ